jgi:hypothetical protein
MILIGWPLSLFLQAIAVAGKYKPGQDLKTLISGVNLRRFWVIAVSTSGHKASTDSGQPVNF